ncbi:hypothetical protein N6H18_16640 [Reichenbachiella agarivorans]|uniref:Holin of 3TMs, for gene-transfer release n=1 Tax=Reichenbachiella agarivorans TaxID=2979464 RepID=A0ABY6CN82_9BACT|nr:hypothetical protein [Reichenbachiella agarivorans]UXP31974.1 hypothetical protein N6H18_16640 [Reichenbachiella agarivorans]
MKELYHEEQKILSDYVGKVKNKDLSMEDAVGIAVNYKDLLDQSKVITRISDRLQKKLDHANQKIKSQNSEIQKKNSELEVTIDQLDKMTVGKKASRIMFVIAIVVFVAEEQFLSPVIQDYVGGDYLGLALLLIIAMILKFFEGGLEKYFLKQTKNKILGNTSSAQKNQGVANKSNLSYVEGK